MAKLEDVKYQAIIVIHGIGEQKPMEVIRSFADAILGKPKKGVNYYNRPDILSECLELRVLQAKGHSDDEKSAKSKLPPAQFFEYYWAYKVKGTTIGNFMAWVKTLLFRNPFDENTLPKHLRTLWWLIWIVLACIIAIIVIIIVFRKPDLSAWGSALAVVLAFIEGLIVDHAGDAARYLDSSPKNIEVRRDIKTDGIKLLREIHNDPYKRFERVIVVGHSLGSVIGYDILKYFWEECRERYSKPSVKAGKELVTAMDNVRELGRDLIHETKKHPGGDISEKVTAFQEAQHELWTKMREAGNPWLVTDFITLGCPLVHASILMAKDADEFDERKSQRELPTCPPGLDAESDGYHYQNYSSDIEEDKNHTLEVLHSAAQFACTRWTNFYSPSDFVGGPLQKWFGPGIRDIKTEIHIGNPLRKWLAMLGSHGSYWKDSNEYTSLTSLRKILDLKGEHTYIENSG